MMMTVCNDGSDGGDVDVVDDGGGDVDDDDDDNL